MYFNGLGMAMQWSKHVAAHLNNIIRKCVNGEWYKQHSGLSKIKIFISVLHFVTFCWCIMGHAKMCFFSEILKNESFLAGVKMCSNLHCRVTGCQRVECVQGNNISFVWLNQMEVIIYRQLRWEVILFAVDRARSGIYERCGCGGATDRTLPVIEPWTSKYWNTCKK